MAATVGNLITASTYNAIRSRVNKVIGSGDGAEYGYGQTLSSSLMSDNDIITAQDMQNLYDDLLLAAKHQTGNPPTWSTPDGLNAPSTGEIVGVYAADLGPADPNTGEQTSINSVNDIDEGYLDFEQAAVQIDTNHFDTGAGALSTDIADTSVRTSPWKTSIDHVFTVQWNSYNHRRTWANAGGKIRFNANLTGGTSQPGDETNTPPGTKDEIWQTMLNSMGTIEIGVQGTTCTGTGTPSQNTSIIYTNRSIPVNWSNTSPANKQTVFVKSGSGVYSENSYVIEAAEVDDAYIRFYITFNDSDVGDSQAPPEEAEQSVPIDENVTGIVTSTITLITPDGFLDIDQPSVIQDSAL